MNICKLKFILSNPLLLEADKELRELGIDFMRMKTVGSEAIFEYAGEATNVIIEIGAKARFTAFARGMKTERQDLTINSLIRAVLF